MKVCLSEGQNGTLLLPASLSVDGQVVVPHQWSAPYRAFHMDSAWPGGSSPSARGPGAAHSRLLTVVTGHGTTHDVQNPMMTSDSVSVAQALADLPNEHLWALGDSIKAMPASLALAWLAELVLWERKRRFGEVPGGLPEPSIPPDQIPVAMLLLQIFAE